ncbi:transposase [Siphonobacter sp. SORGH_AS_1065]|uniref:REP-associated tyrosine transposase n=1 Tax=Siphonobacter sp. SORGH_AS_1065 TaxID=3041795 RepID=UPI00278184AE|nr:transposase [Siphonobacter sp. SORGH_AS_1065]MDQ1087251.1 putative transposase [Siphonobacter sp. SORGH_AS_1065]
MSELRKTYPEGLFFLSISVQGWIDVFIRPSYVEELLKSLRYCQANKGLQIYAYVVMSSHIHLIASRKEGNLSEVLRDFKSYTAKRILKLIEENQQESRRDWLLNQLRYWAKYTSQNEQYVFWQKTNHPIALYTPQVTRQKMDYIHLNPVAAGIVTDPSHYYLSSAHPMSPIKVLPI